MGGIVARRLPTATSRAVAPLARFSTPPASPHRALSSSATRGGGFFELRQYDITPGGFKAYMEQTSTTAGVRRELFQTAESSWLAFFTTEIGPALSRVHHLYYYADYDVRDKVRSDCTTAFLVLLFLVYPSVSKKVGVAWPRGPASAPPTLNPTL